MALKEEKLYELTDYEEVAVERKTKKIALKMKSKNEPIEKIIDYTALSKEEIDKL